MRLKILLAFTALSVLSTTAQTKFASIFNDHMVLQRNTDVQIWGTDKPNTKIVIKGSWGAESKTKSDKNGHWRTTLKTTKAGGPFTLKASGAKETIINDILLGEVWLCSGQSNMAMSLDGGPGQHIEDSNEMILNSNNSNLRFITVKRGPSGTLKNSIEGAWEVSSPATTPNFSAVAYSFGQRLQKYLNVPVGLISSNVGGTPAQAWTPKETIESKFPEFTEELSGKYTTQTATGLYNAMIHPLVPFTLKGTIWYQGEGNAKKPSQYAKLFPEMIKSWRAKWNQTEFPFYFVQIAPFNSGQKENWVKLQQAQLKTMFDVPNTGMVVLNDIGYKTRIHPPKKKEVGQRLALWALAKNYGVEGIIYSGPTYKNIKIKGNKALITFNNANTGITSMGKSLTNFEIAGEDGTFYPAKAKILKKGKFLQVWSDQVTTPLNVRYGWKNYFEGCLFNTAGLPASGFTTESWENVFN